MSEGDEVQLRRQKKIRSLKMSYEKQQKIYITCRNYYKQPPKVRERIARLCSAVAKGDENNRNALFKVLTTETPIWRIAEEHYMSKTLLYELRRRFYELFEKNCTFL